MNIPYHLKELEKQYKENILQYLTDQLEISKTDFSRNYFSDLIREHKRWN